MDRTFRKDILDPNRFAITMELVPGEQSRGRSVDTVMAIASDALADGRVSAVTITDNPGGHPSLSPDVLGEEIVRRGLDVIVHFACRDENRVGLESRALQLGLLGIRNILALTGDFSGEGFAGQGAPVFDLDSVTLLTMLKMMDEGTLAPEDREEFFTGCAISPFKRTEPECLGQYQKLRKKVLAQARFAITQVGYDARKFHELLCVQRDWNMEIPTLGSVYVLAPGAARIMAQGRIPGVVVTKELLGIVESEWEDKKRGHAAAIERSARLAVILKGLGYRGVHFGGIHKGFETLSRILDRMGEIEDGWQEFLPDFDFPQENGFYLYVRDPKRGLCSKELSPRRSRASNWEKAIFQFCRGMHYAFFRHSAPFASQYQAICSWLDKGRFGNSIMRILESIPKKLMFSCEQCGDCGIQHTGFLCPETQCPKRTRNGPCGGSRDGMCEVHTERHCVWCRAYVRWASVNQADRMIGDFVPPRMWELNHTSSWLNFHLRKDHQGEGG
ncbi:MAG: methylenetetrahydrofolate reductase C-terminal domain-containing protein [Desulfatiglandaceae bacterium]